MLVKPAQEVKRALTGKLGSEATLVPKANRELWVWMVPRGCPVPPGVLACPVVMASPDAVVLPASMARSGKTVLPDQTEPTAIQAALVPVVRPEEMARGVLTAQQVHGAPLARLVQRVPQAPPA